MRHRAPTPFTASRSTTARHRVAGLPERGLITQQRGLHRNGTPTVAHGLALRYERSRRTSRLLKRRSISAAATTQSRHALHVVALRPRDDVLVWRCRIRDFHARRVVAFVQTEHTSGDDTGHGRQRVAMRPHAQPGPPGVR